MEDCGAGDAPCVLLVLMKQPAPKASRGQRRHTCSKHVFFLYDYAKAARRRGGIEPLHVPMPHELKSCPSTSPTHPGNISRRRTPKHINQISHNARATDHRPQTTDHTCRKRGLSGSLGGLCGLWSVVCGLRSAVCGLCGVVFVLRDSAKTSPSLSTTRTNPPRQARTKLTPNRPRPVPPHPYPHHTPCGTRARPRRSRSPTPRRLGQGGPGRRAKLQIS